MVSYLLATGAAWLAASVVAFLGHAMILNDLYKTTSPSQLEEKAAQRRVPLYYLARLAFALVLVYLVHLLAPGQANWQTGLQLGALAGLLTYLPLAFEQFARHAPAQLIITSTLIGIVQATAAGIAAALVFSL